MSQFAHFNFFFLRRQIYFELSADLFTFKPRPVESR